MNKRSKFIISSLLLSMGFVGIQLLEDQFRILAIILLSAFTLVLFVWSLYEGLGKNATLLVLVLPTLFTIGVGFFWFLLPTTIFARLPIVILYGLGIYALNLTSNIFTVAAIRTIALSRAAKGVGFLLTLFTSFLLFDAILSIRGEIWFNLVTVMIVAFPLFFQGLWTSILDKNLSSNVYLFSVIFALGLGEMAALIYFWPVTVVVGSLFLTVGVYVMLGLGQARLEERLFSQTTKEYLLVGILVFIAMLFATSWGG